MCKSVLIDISLCVCVCAAYKDWYLVIHNVDGVALRTEKAQLVLSLLSELRGCHIIASIDHVNSALRMCS